MLVHVYKAFSFKPGSRKLILSAVLVLYRPRLEVDNLNEPIGCKLWSELEELFYGEQSESAKASL